MVVRVGGVSAAEGAAAAAVAERAGTEEGKCGGGQGVAETETGSHTEGLVDALGLDGRSGAKGGRSEQGIVAGGVDEGVVEAGEGAGCGDAVRGGDLGGVNLRVVGVNAGRGDGAGPA